MTQAPAPPPAAPRQPLAAARDLAGRILGRLQREPSALRLAVTGPLRRMCPDVAGIDLLATAHEPAALLDAFEAMPLAEATVERRADGARVRLRGGAEASLTVLPAGAGRFVPALVALTGGAAHVEALVARATERGLRLDDAGLFEGAAPVALGAEEDLYARLGLPFRPPELREDADLGPPPEDLVTMADVRGLVGVHTSDGEGAFPLGHMARRASREGFGWVVVADRGLDEAALARQRAEIEALAAAPEEEPALPRVFLGLEVGVRADGALDATDAALDAADLVLLRPGAGTRADALAGAVARAGVRILAHGPASAERAWADEPAGRERVLAACAASGVALALSGAPGRMAYGPALHREAKALGVDVAPAADALDLVSIDNVIAAVGAARRGAWRRGDVVPARDADAFEAWLRGDRA